MIIDNKVADKTSYSASQLSEFIAETERLVNKSIQCLKDDPENENARFNLTYSFVDDITKNRTMVNKNYIIVPNETNNLMDRLNDIDAKRRAAIRDLDKVFKIKKSERAKIYDKTWYY